MGIVLIVLGCIAVVVLILYMTKKADDTVMYGLAKTVKSKNRDVGVIIFWIIVVIVLLIFVAAG